MPEPGEPDYDRLAQSFRALSYAVRLELLHQLRFPRDVYELRVSPRQLRPGENPDRPMSRQSVLGHLETLHDIGVIVAREAHGGRGRTEYQVNAPRLYQLMEEFRRVGTVFVGAPLDHGGTVALDAPPGPGTVRGPRLLLVHGLVEGKPFPLGPDRDRWVIGRRADADVSLDYDPYVSVENTAVTRDGDHFYVEDLAGSRNGTTLDWRRLQAGERVRLAAGDVIGVGRSALVFKDA